LYFLCPEDKTVGVIVKKKVEKKKAEKAFKKLKCIEVVLRETLRC